MVDSSSSSTVRRSRALLPILTALTVFAVGCVGLVLDPPGSDHGPGGPGGPGTPPGTPIDPDADVPDDVTAAPMRRLSNDELATAIHTLTGTTPTALAMLPGDVADARTLFFPGIAGRQPLARAEVLFSLVDEAALGMTAAQIERYAPACATRDRACAVAFADAFARRAFRRPLEDGERTAMLALYDDAGDHDDGMAQIVRLVLMSASFLYVPEIGTPDPDHDGRASLTSLELASRLSLGLTDDVPDDALLEAAVAGELTDRARLRAEAERLFETDAAKQTVRRFFTYWLGLDDVAALERDGAAFPEFDAALNQSMLEETHTFLAYQTWEARAPLHAYFDADFTFADARLAAHYGIASPGTDMARVPLPPERRGLLTQAAILSHDQGATFTRPIQRSVYLLRRLLCTDLPPPPEDVNASPRASAAGTTTRETYESLTSVAPCAGCHATIINPPGFAFEDFDAVGGYRTTERGRPVDASGGIPSASVSDLNGGASVGEAVATLDAIHVCFARQWLRFVLARPESQADATSLRSMVDASRAGAPVRDVMLSVVDTFAFTHRATPAE